MTENTNPTTTPADTAGASGHRYRVTGTLPMTITVTAPTADDARTQATATITHALTDRDDVRATPENYVIGTPSQTEQPASDGMHTYAVPVSAVGCIDITSGDPLTARVAALDTMQRHLGQIAGVVVHVDAAMCDDSIEIPGKDQ